MRPVGYFLPKSPITRSSATVPPLRSSDQRQAAAGLQGGRDESAFRRTRWSGLDCEAEGVQLIPTIDEVNSGLLAVREGPCASSAVSHRRWAMETVALGYPAAQRADRQHDALVGRAEIPVPKVAGGVCAGCPRLGTDGLRHAHPVRSEDELVEALTFAWRMAQPKPRRSRNKS